MIILSESLANLVYQIIFQNFILSPLEEITAQYLSFMEFTKLLRKFESVFRFLRSYIVPDHQYFLVFVFQQVVRLHSDNFQWDLSPMSSPATQVAQESCS